MNSNMPAKRPIFFGWYVVFAAVFIGFAAAGARNGFGVFIEPMTEEFGWNRLIISTAFSVGVLLNGVIQPFIGAAIRPYRRAEPRPVLRPCPGPDHYGPGLYDAHLVPDFSFSA